METSLQFHELALVNREQSVKGILNEPDLLRGGAFNKFNRCLGYVWDLGKCYKHFSIKIPYRVLALCFRFHSYLRNFYAILNSINNMFLCKQVFTRNCNVVINNIVYLGQLIQRIVFLCVFITVFYNSPTSTMA
jgi:hypothetical protein